MDGYYINSNTCAGACDVSCKTCSDSGASDCLSCYPGSILNINTCTWPRGMVRCTEFNPTTCTKCIKGYYWDGSSCVQCDSACDECTGGLNTDCIKCRQSYFLSGNTCTQCHAACTRCTGNLNSNCIGPCAPGYKKDGSNCVLCPS